MICYDRLVTVQRAFLVRPVEHIYISPRVFYVWLRIIEHMDMDNSALYYSAKAARPAAEPSIKIREQIDIIYIFLPQDKTRHSAMQVGEPF